MRLLDRTGWIADPFVRDGGRPTLVPFAQAESAIAQGDPIGIEIANTTDAGALDPWLGRVDLIAILFPQHRDGRGFSLARQLRERGFARRLRATGALIPDQFGFALACGFDEVEIDETRAGRQPVEQWLAALAAIDLAYQDSAARPSIFELRRRAA